MSNVLGMSTSTSGSVVAAPAVDFYIYDLPKDHGISVGSATLRVEERESLSEAETVQWVPRLYKLQHDDESSRRTAEYQTGYFGSTVCLDPKAPLFRSRFAAFWHEFGLEGQFYNVDHAKHAALLHQGTRFNFQCSPEGVLAFFRDHKKHRSWRMEHMTLQYAFWNTPDTGRKSTLGWRDMMDKLRHEFALVDDIKVYVCEEFWQRAQWQTTGAAQVIEDDWLDACRPNIETFL